jgi:hypothetical protein
MNARAAAGRHELAMDARTPREKIAFYCSQAIKALAEANAAGELGERGEFLHVALAWLDLATEVESAEEKTTLN